MQHTVPTPDKIYGTLSPSVLGSCWKILSALLPSPCPRTGLLDLRVSLLPPPFQAPVSLERMRVAVEVEALVRGFSGRSLRWGGVQAGPQQGREVTEAGSGSRSIVVAVHAPRNTQSDSLWLRRNRDAGAEREPLFEPLIP